MRTALLIMVLAGAAGARAAEPPKDAAALFGARTMHWGASLSPDASQIAYMTAVSAGGTGVMVANVKTGLVKLVVPAIPDAEPGGCRWKSEVRLICAVGGVKHKGIYTDGFSRLLSINVATGELIGLGGLRKGTAYGGSLLSLLPNDPKSVLMTVGWQVSRVDVVTGEPVETVEREGNVAQTFEADPKGDIRYREISGARAAGGFLKDQINFGVRAKGSKSWVSIERRALTDEAGSEFLGFDESGDYLLALKPHEGRRALFKVAADGSGRSELLFAHPVVDVSGVLRLGRDDRPVAATYTVDAAEYHYSDPALLKLSASLSRALPGKPTVDVFDESWDGKRKLVFVGRNGDPGRLHLYDANTRELSELLQLRPNLAGVPLATVTAVTYPARDGTRIPAYLTLPRDRQAKNLPTIVMPHGGPASRDQLGFDWLAQFWASQGYAVLQPNFRGSAGYGQAWYAKNGFQSWPIAIGDIDDGARWMVAEGKSDPRRLAIVGWSYGGYAALQAGVTEPGLYRAIVAIAPVTDLIAMKDRGRRFVNFPLLDKFLGSGPHLTTGSPARNAARITAPVLMFSGDQDLNVDISQSRLMQAALKKAGKTSELIVYPGLDHQLDDSDRRTEMLRKSAAFVAAAMPISP